MGSTVIAGRIFFARYELRCFEQLSVLSFSYLIDGERVKVDVDCPWDMISMSCLLEKYFWGVFDLAILYFSFRVDAVLLREELPAGIAYLGACLSQMDIDQFFHYFMIRLSGFTFYLSSFGDYD